MKTFLTIGEFLIDEAVREVKIALVGGAWWKARTGAADLNAVLETAARVPVSLNGWRTVKDMLARIFSGLRHSAEMEYVDNDG